MRTPLLLACLLLTSACALNRGARTTERWREYFRAHCYVTSLLGDDERHSGPLVITYRCDDGHDYVALGWSAPMNWRPR